MARESLFPDLSRPIRGAVPRKLVRQLAPSNPKAKVTFRKSVELMVTRRLAPTIREDRLSTLRANSTWLVAFEMLEDRGLHKGLHVTELAEARGMTVSAAKKAMLVAEKKVYEVFGINISFIDRDGVWRLATEREVALKYAQMLRTIKTVSQRVGMYHSAAAKLGVKDGRVQLPLFKFPQEE